MTAVVSGPTIVYVLTRAGMTLVVAVGVSVIGNVFVPVAGIAAEVTVTSVSVNAAGIADIVRVIGGYVSVTASVPTNVPVETPVVSGNE